MDVKNVLHMNEGGGKTSYAANSSLQKHGLEVVKPITEDAARDMLSAHLPDSLGIADLGCSSGPNTFYALITIIRAACLEYQRYKKPLPEFRVYLNDLPGNDFNSIFRALPAFYESVREKDGVLGSCFVAGVAGSFYARIFPANSLHFVHASYSLNWRSQVPLGLYNEEGMPLNKGHIYIDEASPPEVAQAYLQQFQKDFSSFLGFRSREIVRGGYMVLIFFGRTARQEADKEFFSLWKVLNQAILSLFFKGLIDKEKLDSFDLPFYSPSVKEVEEEVKREGSFTLKRFEQLPIAPWGANDNGKDLAFILRAVMEPLTKYHFGEELMDLLFEEYARLLQLEINEGKKKLIHFVLVLKRTN
ncbi:salicylate carboxymethyltransferase [Amborella trichopoda]|uniref:Uncharacterized protein n=1 Tax=Amborella trichopoda TaxID=13333 RepID=U5DA47_AMBTC|nr:salicylate carboxymethyltransferase [Amborella trichopoda]ERN19065.1 hypothetical protein AMTR_s00061p00098470 [Amborella trichopoda]|eukprot:XP_006857598.1 salicylate carboxymethyltransferase [Amborella trichopoda]